MALNCISKHTVYIYDRGGKTRIDQVLDIRLVRWNRIRDDISEGTVYLSAKSCAAQADFLASIEPGRHEMVIFRGDERVWEGPMGLVKYTRSGAELHAHDVMYYAYKTAMHAAYSSAYPNTEFVVARAKRIMIAELARKEALSPPINVLPYLTDHQTPTDAKTSRVTKAMEKTVWEHVDDMAARGGMDYVTVGRAIHLWDTSKPLGQTPTVTEDDFLGDVYVSVYGSELATRSIVTDGEGVWGSAGGVDPYYGEWEDLETAYDETDGESPPTSAEMASQASRNLAGRNPTPLQIRVPDNSSLNPNGVLAVTDLVPGVFVPMRAQMTARKVMQMQKLNKVQFEETADGENITVVMFPASGSDEPPPEEG